MAEPTLTEWLGASAATGTGTITFTPSEISDQLSEASSSEALLIGQIEAFIVVQDQEPNSQVAIIKASPNQVQRNGSTVLRTAFTVQVFTALPTDYSLADL